jgi:hypothetical protein
MKPSFELLKVRFVYKIERTVSSDMLGRIVKETRFVGDYHIFEFLGADVGLVGFAFCGSERSKIGEETKDSEKIPAGVPVCKACEAAWKKHPRSAWKAWVVG